MLQRLCKLYKTCVIVSAVDLSSCLSFVVSDAYNLGMYSKSDIELWRKRTTSKVSCPPPTLICRIYLCGVCVCVLKMFPAGLILNWQCAISEHGLGKKCICWSHGAVQVS